VFRIFNKLGSPEGEGFPLLHVDVDTPAGPQPWVLSIGGSVSDTLSHKTVPYQAACITGTDREIFEGRAEYYRRAGIPVGLVRRCDTEAEVVLGAAPVSHTAPKEKAPNDLIFILGTGDIDTDPAEARKLMRLMRKERVARFVKSCEKNGMDGLAVTVSEEDAPLFCVEADREDLSCRQAEEPAAVPGRPRNPSGDGLACNPAGTRPWDNLSLTPAERLLLLVSSPSFCSQQGLAELFDPTVGAGGVLSPHGGAASAAPEQVMAALIPAPGSRTAGLAAYACCGMVSAAKLVAAGCAPDDIYLHPHGNLRFAVAAVPASRVLPSHFMRRGSLLYLTQKWEVLHTHILQGEVLSAYACETGGVAGALAHMSLSGLSACVEPELYDDSFFDAPPGSIVFESPRHIEGERVVGVVQQKPEFQLGKNFIPLQSLYTAWWQPLEAAYPTEMYMGDGPVPALEYSRRAPSPVHLLSARPLALAPVFPGTTGEFEMAGALASAGAIAETPLLRTLRPDWLEQSAEAIGKLLKKAQLLILHGNADFIAEFFRREQPAYALRDLLDRRGGLVLGISGGFHALISLGLLPGVMLQNAIGTHRSRYIQTRVSSVLSPWLMRCATDEIHVLPVSCAAGRLSVSEDEAEALMQGGQVAFQYCDARGVPSMATFINPTGSVLAAEGITSPDGRILGKIAHPERAGFYIGKNIPGNKQQPVFEGGVRYFR
jgi:phosphoribosylformylglycinamidine (FGAM) synthase-like amidotransferase family enzyme